MGKSGSKYVTIGRTFSVERVVGRGAFGKVHCIVDVDTKKMYALKVMDKTKIAEKGDKVIQGTIREKDMLYEVNHPLIVNLLSHGQDEYNLYMILDLMLGGELEFHLKAKKKERWTEDNVKFYCAQLVSVLEYLHEEASIVHRDIKPQNLLLDEFGNIHLTDFNVSLPLEVGKKTSGFSGTKGYMAPEVLNDEPYDHNVDIWASGIILYRMLSGRFPWQQSKTREDLVEEVKTVDKLEYPDDVSDECKDCIKKMLSYSPDDRPSARELRNHPWLKDLCFEDVKNKKLESPVTIKVGVAHVDQRMMLDEYMRDQVDSNNKKRATLEDAGTKAKFEDWETGERRLEPSESEGEGGKKKKKKHTPL
mmetsp:Transcript_26337/g.73597  ORF Transcript_26337/g.73597 Transcript_26337/m.73597 type:complete len:363 (+) Transcript_26337:62-1150(+)|eukprot:CAMPEP_0119122384 /NCGR_PEP_ID=MMETSP1310-20130426/2656_1 /TAXON_ID=464262 /ORGANISM="Genus nov. species nov., Strain RCC2339" /LENGTH=362 /DNA_ID=CAMNT_0007112033 /DNA_START=52 /DNA_END=1140 /DNA_ORIENTATION=+